MKLPLYTLLLATLTATAQAASFTVHSTALTDGQPISKAYVGAEAACGSGAAQTPPVSWSNLPNGTRSVAVVLFDPDGGKGLGVAHWVAYNIDPARGQLREGEAPSSIDGVTVGNNMTGTAAYRGLCPPAGDPPHDYVLTVIASDLAPGALPAGLGRDALLSALKGHALGGQSVSGRYGH